MLRLIHIKIRVDLVEELPSGKEYLSSSLYNADLAGGAK